MVDQSGQELPRLRVEIATLSVGARAKEREGQNIIPFIPLHVKFLQFDWLRVVVFQLNLKYLDVKITNLLQVVV